MSRIVITLRATNKPPYLVTEIFNILYPDEPVWAGCSTDTVGMVRFFAPAAIWSNLAKQPSKDDQSAHKPPEKVARFKEMLDVDKKGFYTEEFWPVVANARKRPILKGYSFLDPCDPDNPKMPHRHVQQVLLKKLDAATEDPPHQFLLPHGHKADSHTIALDLTLLDSLTFYAKWNITPFLLKHMKDICASGRLPSPALIGMLKGVDYPYHHLVSFLFMD